MQFVINNASDRAVYQQIIDQVKRDIALGRIVKDEKLPTVRQLAQQLAINPNTIAKAYKQMEQEGIIVTKPGAGAFIAETSSNLNKAIKKKIICQKMDRIIIEAIHMQLDKGVLGEWFCQQLEKFKFADKKGISHE